MTEKQTDFDRIKERFGDPTAELHAAYDPWLEEMSGRDDNRLLPFEFDLEKHPEQSIYTPVVEAQPAFPDIPDWLYYAGFRLKMSRSLGQLSTRRLINEFQNQPASAEDPTPLPERLNANQRDGKNTLVVTSHINFQEFGYVKGIKHIAAAERHDVHKSGSLLSKLMTRQEYKGKKLVNHFTPVGKVYFSSPKSATADRHKVPQGAAELTNALLKKVLKPALAEGGVELDAALAGSAVKPIKDEKGNLLYYKIPEVHQSSARLLEYFDDAVGITLVGPPLAKHWTMEIGEVMDVQELLKSYSVAQVTDMIYSGIRLSIEKITKREVVYKKVSGELGKAATASFSKP